MQPLACVLRRFTISWLKLYHEITKTRSGRPQAPLVECFIKQVELIFEYNIKYGE
jgi:hypothetical protein